jgi:L-asparaginase / beta-aspartyl-peptidase
LIASKPVIIVHGGAGTWPISLHKSGLEGVRTAADLGFAVLSKGGNAIDAVEKAIVSMEDNPTFNAGTGSSLNLLGEVETDSAIMDGRSLNGGAVALLRRIRNPIKVARLVMEKTDHVLIAGEPARKLAIDNGLPQANLKTGRRVQAWREGIEALTTRTHNRRTTKLKTIQSFMNETSDTVGALALDHESNLAAGDSTGGINLKLPGRIGDSSILGAGLYADNKSGAATATGIGEQAIRLAISKVACDSMRHMSTPSAAAKTIQYATRIVGTGTGLITLDRKGKVGAAHNTQHLCWAFKTGTSSDERITGRRITR